VLKVQKQKVRKGNKKMSEQAPTTVEKKFKTRAEVAQQVSRIVDKLNARGSEVLVPANGARQSELSERAYLTRETDSSTGATSELAKGTYSSGNEFIRAKKIDRQNALGTSFAAKETPKGDIILEKDENLGDSRQTVEVSKNYISGKDEQDIYRTEATSFKMDKGEMIHSAAEVLSNIRGEVAAHEIAKQEKADNK
jgi:hypothetical protein